jgi:glycosyltransferase involved in cell wall biosynthesis
VFPDVGRQREPYTDPWNATYEERVLALGRRSRRVAYVYDKAPDASTFRYRLFNMVEALEAAPELDISASWFTTADLRPTNAFVERADVMVLCRAHYSHALERVIAQARARGARVVFDVDDLVFDPRYAGIVGQSLDMKMSTEAEWDYWFAYMGRLGAALKMCDAGITTTPTLREQMQSCVPGLAVSVVPNFLNRLQMKVSDRLASRKRAGHYRRDGMIDLGYFSGTPTHNRDLLVASPALSRIFDRFPEVRLRLVGFIELNEFLEPYRDRIELICLQDYVNLQPLIAEVEVNIVPLQNNLFTNCKSELKYFEAGIVGVVTVATPTEPFAQAIRDGENGFLAGAHQWEEKLCQVIGMLRDDPGSYEAMAEATVADVAERYAWNTQASRIEAALFPSGSGRRESDRAGRTRVMG